MIAELAIARLFSMTKLSVAPLVVSALDTLLHKALRMYDAAVASR
jgi:hypothetical protein